MKIMMFFKKPVVQIISTGFFHVVAFEFGYLTKFKYPMVSFFEVCFSAFCFSTVLSNFFLKLAEERKGKNLLGKKAKKAGISVGYRYIRIGLFILFLLLMVWPYVLMGLI